jgi:hypothetical protein
MQWQMCKRDGLLGLIFFGPALYLLNRGRNAFIEVIQYLCTRSSRKNVIQSLVNWKKSQ